MNPVVTCALRPFTVWRRPKFDDVAAALLRATADADVTLK
jgi:hypothetical protein